MTRNRSSRARRVRMGQSSRETSPNRINSSPEYLKAVMAANEADKQEDEKKEEFLFLKISDDDRRKDDGAPTTDAASAGRNFA